MPKPYPALAPSVSSCMVFPIRPMPAFSVIRAFYAAAFSALK